MQGRQSLLDAGGVGDPRTFQRHVVIDAIEDAGVREGELVNSADFDHMNSKDEGGGMKDECPYDAIHHSSFRLHPSSSFSSGCCQRFLLHPGHMSDQVE